MKRKKKLRQCTAEQPVQNNEQKVESNEKQGKFLVVIDPGHQQKANLTSRLGQGRTTQKI